MRLSEDLNRGAPTAGGEFGCCAPALQCAACSLAISVDDIVEAAHPPAEMSVLALQLHTAQSFARSSQSSCAMRCRCELGLEQRVLAGPLVAGRPLGHQSSRHQQPNAELRAKAKSCRRSTRCCGGGARRWDRRLGAQDFLKLL